MKVFHGKESDGRDPVEVVGDACLDRESVAAVAGVSSRTINNWVRDGRFPPPDLRPTAKSPRWRASTVRAWMAAGGGA